MLAFLQACTDSLAQAENPSPGLDRLENSFQVVSVGCALVYIGGQGFSQVKPTSSLCGKGTIFGTDTLLRTAHE